MNKVFLPNSDELYDWLEMIIESMNFQRSIKSGLDVIFPKKYSSSYE